MDHRFIYHQHRLALLIVEGIRDGCKMGVFVKLLFEHLLEKLCAGTKGFKGLKWFAYPVYN